jgi:hypothetical protein
MSFVTAKQLATLPAFTRSESHVPAIGPLAALQGVPIAGSRVRPKEEPATLCGPMFGVVSSPRYIVFKRPGWAS